MRPRRPYFVNRSRGRNQRTSSGLWNIQRMTALYLCTFTGKPVRTSFLRTTRSGSVLRSAPADKAADAIECVSPSDSQSERQSAEHGSEPATR